MLEVFIFGLSCGILIGYGLSKIKTSLEIHIKTKEEAEQ